MTKSSGVRTFELRIPPDRSLEDGLAEAHRRGAGVGIRFQGDATSGSFAGTASGRYRVDGRTLFLEVEKKPVFVPWALVERELKRIFP